MSIMSLVKPSVRFSGVSLPVSDLDQSVEFYRQVGFEVRVANERQRFVLLGLGTGTLGLLEVPAGARETDLPRKLRALVQIELETDDLDGLYQTFLQAGVAVPTPRRDRGFERSMQCRDPDGFTIEFAQGERGNNATDPGYWNKGSGGGAPVT
jgi:catechol 2,3-dioxygenase-like lactoylglutathione lyase family enzyme